MLAFQELCVDSDTLRFHFCMLFVVRVCAFTALDCPCCSSVCQWFELTIYFWISVLDTFIGTSYVLLFERACVVTVLCMCVRRCCVNMLVRAGVALCIVRTDCWARALNQQDVAHR